MLLEARFINCQSMRDLTMHFATDKLNVIAADNSVGKSVLFKMLKVTANPKTLATIEERRQLIRYGEQYAGFICAFDDGSIGATLVYPNKVIYKYRGNVKNTFKTVYRVERGDKAKKAFVPADDSNLLIEPFDDSNQLELEKRKTNIINTESGIPRKDQNSGTNIETYFNPVLNPMSLDNSVFSKNTIIVSGDRKSGVSVWSAALAVSASKLDKPVMLFDFTDNSDISELLSDNFIEFKSYRMQELLHSFSLYNRINVCAAFNADERSVRMELLRYLFENVALTKYQVIIAIDNSVLKHAIDLLQNNINRVLYCIVPLKADLLLAQPILNQLTENCELVIVLNKNISLMPKSSYVSEDQIKELFPNNKAIIRSINFEDFELDEDVFLSVMGV